MADKLYDISKFDHTPADREKTLKEKIYDEQIEPLMLQIIDICDKHKIANIQSFCLTDTDADVIADEDGESKYLMCTSIIIGDGEGVKYVTPDVYRHFLNSARTNIKKTEDKDREGFTSRLRKAFSELTLEDFEKENKH